METVYTKRGRRFARRPLGFQLLRLWLEYQTHQLRTAIITLKAHHIYTGSHIGRKNNVGTVCTDVVFTYFFAIDRIDRCYTLDS